jgi:predicted RNA methylase
VVARHNGAALAFEVRAVSSSSSSSFVGGGQAAPSFHLEPTTTAAAAAAASAPDASACRPPLRSAADREVDASTASAPRPPAIPTLALALASDTPRLSILSRAVAKAVARHCAVAGGRPPAVLDAGAGGTAALALAAAAAGAREVVAAEAHPQLAATARANVALNARAVAVGGGRVRVVCGDAARLERGGGVGGGDAPAEGFHLVVFDPCAGADPNSGAPLALLDGIRRRCMAVAAGGSDVAASHPPQPPPRVVPRAATVWAVGLEVLSSALVPGAASPELDDGLGGLPADLSPLDRFRWRGGVACSAEAEGPPGLSSALPPPCRGALAAEVGWDPIHLASLPHVRLTKPARVMTMDFAAALAGGRGSGVAAAAAAGGDSQHHAALRVERAGTLNAVAYWAEMHLGDDDGDDDEASSYSMGPPASYFGAGGGGSGPGPGDNTNGSGPGTDPRGQALQYLETWTSQGGVRPGDVAHLDVRLGSRCVRFRLLGVEAATAAEEERDGDGGPPSPCPLRPCPRAPWLARAGIESPDVWAVRRCHEVLAQALQRAGRAEPAIRGGGGPGQRNDRRRLPAVWRDFFVLLRHCAPLGLDPAVLAQTAQSVALAEALAAVLSGQEEEEGDGGAGGGSSLALLRASALVSPEVLGVRGAAWR